MAYRSPDDPHTPRHARRQSRVARLVGLVLLVGMVGGLLIVGERVVPAQHAPWKPLSIVDPVGLATRIKQARAGADPALCRAVLRKGGVEFTEEPMLTKGTCVTQDVIRLESGMAPLQPADAPMTCKEALALSLWERQVVQSAAFALLGQGVVGIDNFGSFACRRIYGQASGPMSEHATADALDVSGFTLADGSKITVLADWRDPGPKGAFLRQVRDGACGLFLTTLSPDYNAAHANHLHLDMGGWPMCA